jgi:recombination protein RecT
VGTQRAGGPPNNQRPSQGPTTAQSAGQYARTEQGLTLPSLLANAKDKIAAALPRHMTPERMVRVALTAFYRTPGLWDVDPLTVAGAVIQASELGLEPNGVLGHAYLVPFWNKQAKRRECQLLVGYKGYIDLARRSGRVLAVNAHIVHAADDFECELGTEEFCKHKPLLYRKDQRTGNIISVAEEDRGPMILTYGFAKLRDEGTALELMSIADVEKIRQNDSSAPNSPAWTDHYAWMVRKTVLRQLCKLLPLSIEMQTAVGLEDTAAAGMSQNLQDNLLDMEKTGATYSIPEGAGQADPQQQTGGAGEDPDARDKQPPRQQPQQQQQPRTGPQPPQQQGTGGSLTTDDFEPAELQTLQGLLKYATADMDAGAQINNRARVNAWLGQFDTTAAAMKKAEDLKYEAEQRRGGSR